MTVHATPVPLLKPPPAPLGSNVNVISPASFANTDRVERGLERLRALGFAPRLGTHTQVRGPLFFAGSPESRLADLHCAFADP